MDFNRVLQPGRQSMHSRQVECATHHRQECQDHQRNRDHSWAFLRMDRGGMTRLAKENQPDLASHIERSQECGDCQQHINKSKAFAERVCQDFILRPESCEWRDSSQRQSTNHIDPEGGRHGLTKTAHVAHVIRVEHFSMRRLVLFYLPRFLSFALLTMLSMFGVVMSTLNTQNDRARGKE